ncbi:MAG: hypothetical protein KIS83_13190 [Rubrivivax sp.]|nr:hypothetical protein [Rubrivivax sp.]
MKRAHHLAAACLAALAAASPAAAQTFTLEGAVLDSRSAQNLGVVSERGDIATLFRAQKAMTFGILRAAGIPLDQLSPEVRARIERFQTTNLEAFRAFSQGLDLKDQGRFAEAREFFRRAAELDPGFALAAEQQQAMPDVNLGTGVQVRAVLAAAAGAAVDRGRSAVAVDVARATAALQAGQTVVTIAAAPAERAQAAATGDGFTANPPGSSTQFLPNLAAGIVYTYTVPPAAPVSIAIAGEWRADRIRFENEVLESLGTAGDFQAQRGGATVVAQGSAPVGDGSLAYWGRWASTPSGSASVSVNNTAITAPTLGPVDWIYADATRQMPTTGSAVFTPAAGPTMNNASGSIAVNFATRAVTLNNLGFTIGGQTFSALTGSASIDPRIASGAFGGNYSGGACSGCAGFTPLASTFGGHFLGREANGLLFSTILLTGDGTAAGVHLFGRPGP